jgi:hypothetical protein
MSPSHEPTDAATRIADAALEAVGVAAGLEAVDVERCFIMVRLEEAPAEEADAATAGTGYDDDILALLADLLEHAKAVGDALGVRIVVAPLHGG